jgi:hypothetical protein
MLIDADPSHMELVIISRGRLLFSRYFKVDVSAQNWESVFVSEVNKSRDAYAKEVAGEAVQKVLVTGQEETAADLVKILNTQEGLSAEVLPHKKISLGASFSSLIGLGVKDIPYSLNLLPQDLRIELIKLSRRREYAKLSLFVGAIVVFIGLGVGKSLDNKAQYLKKLNSELQKLSQEAKPLRDIEKSLSIASGSLKEKPSCLEAFSEVHRIIPASVLLTDFIYDPGKELILRGQAQELNSVLALVSQLESSPVFKKFSAKVRYATKRKTSAGEVVGFEIICSRK